LLRNILLEQLEEPRIPSLWTHPHVPSSSLQVFMTEKQMAEILHDRNIHQASLLNSTMSSLPSHMDQRYSINPDSTIPTCHGIAQPPLLPTSGTSEGIPTHLPRLASFVSVAFETPCKMNRHSMQILEQAESGRKPIPFRNVIDQSVRQTVSSDKRSSVEALGLNWIQCSENVSLKTPLMSFNTVFRQTKNPHSIISSFF
jgi:hypothetical protein